MSHSTNSNRALRRKQDKHKQKLIDNRHKIYDAAVQFFSQGKIQFAFDNLLTLRELEPNNIKVLQKIGDCHLYSKQFALAMETYIDILKIDQNNEDALNSIITVHTLTHNYERAMGVLNYLIERHPNSLKYYLMLSRLQQDRGNFDEANLIRKHANMLFRDRNLIIESLFNMNGWLPSMEEALHREDLYLKRFDEAKEALSHLPIESGFPDTMVNMPFYIAYHDVNPKNYLCKLTDLYRKTYPDISYTAPHVKKWTPKKPGEKIKIGVISAWLLVKTHSVHRVFYPLFDALPRDQFEIVVFDLDHTKSEHIVMDDAITLKVPLNQEYARKIIEKEKLDILFYTDLGMDPTTYFLAFSRLAPIQCVGTGHPITSGIDTVDYYVTTDACEAQDSQDFYVEKLVRFKNFLSVYKETGIDCSNTQRKDFNLPETGALYLCPQANFKLHPKMDALFESILEKDPTGHLIFVASNNSWKSQINKRWSQMLETYKDRIHIYDNFPFQKYIQFLSVMDVVLDTFPFNGGTTSMQAFEKNIPIVTLPKNGTRGRTTTGMYKLMGIYDCLANTEEEYVDTALKLAHDEAFKNDICTRIEKNKSVLFNNYDALEEHIHFFKTVVTTGKWKNS